MAGHPSEVDIIFVGGGTAACAAAGRLAAANPGLEILLVEQGPNNFNEPTVYIPAMVLAHLVPDSKSTLFWQGNKSDKIGGRGPIVASGGVLGGGSSVNFMMYARPAASDLEDWNTAGWGAEDLIPLMRSLMVLQIETYHLSPGGDTHGSTGPVHVSYSNYYSPVSQEYLDVIVHRGVPLVEDLMDTRTGHGCQRLAKYIHPTTCRRQDAAHCYVHSQANNKSLHVLTKSKVTRVVFDGTKATGVEVIANKDQTPDADQTPRVITARRLVVISAGAIGSPMVLQRSGVGCAERLSKLGIHVVSDLPDVGRHYEDHSSLIATFHVADDTETMDCIVEKEPGFMERYLPEFAEGRGFLTTNANDAGSKLRPTLEELKEMGSAFQEVWKRHYEQAPDKPVSRGHVYITSTDPYAAPDFETGFLNEQADVDVLIWAYKKCREVCRRMPSFRGEYAGLHPKFPKGSAAACVRLAGPPLAEINDIVYTAEDNAVVEQFVRETASTTWHSIGTIPMKPNEQGGCVEARLNVYGTLSLKVADLSILPSNVGANTCLTALLIGEKAAVLIAEDLGLNVP
ncbi:hypothetical protein FRC09_006017 [Ceratobasidium sp. 395]|nr:hypothetical protein FRC09_006017 [Ceratobasidium sp. 395]